MRSDSTQITLTELQKWSRYFALGLGLCYLWFGALKFFPTVSPAECLAEATISQLTWGVFHGRLACVSLAAMEVIIGMALIFNYRLKYAALAVIGHMLCTFTPVFLLPDDFFALAPFGLTLVGQYIIKNVVFIAVAFFIYRVHSQSTGEAALAS